MHATAPCPKRSLQDPGSPASSLSSRKVSEASSREQLPSAIRALKALRVLRDDTQSASGRCLLSNHFKIETRLKIDSPRSEVVQANLRNIHSVDIYGSRSRLDDSIQCLQEWRMT